MSAGIAGTLAAVNYLAGISQQYGQEYQDRFPGFSGRRLDLKTGMTVLREYDHVLSAAILDDMESLPGVQIRGITDRSRLEKRVPTVSFTWEGREPREIAVVLGEQGIFAWDGNYCALAVTERLGLEGKGGMVRIGAVHAGEAHGYTVEEINRLGEALRGLDTDHYVPSAASSSSIVASRSRARPRSCAAATTSGGKAVAAAGLNEKGQLERE